MRKCIICNDRDAELAENLCDECGATLATHKPLVPEQIISSNATRTDAALLDQWGRPHYLAGAIELGRQFGSECLAILDSSVSREHATVRPVDSTWMIRENGSTNGTTVADAPLEGERALISGDPINIGSVGFYFVSPTTEVRDLKGELAGETIKPEAKIAAAKPAELASSDDDDESTFSGLPEIAVSLVEPTGGGGGFIKMLDKTVQLTTTQFEFVALLARRMADEPHQPDLVRGFVRSSELLVDISWDTAHPSDNHVKQLVRRVRRTLVRGGIGNLIDSRHRFGYRFRVIPVFPPAHTSA